MLTDEVLHIKNTTPWAKQVTRYDLTCKRKEFYAPTYIAHIKIYKTKIVYQDDFYLDTEFLDWGGNEFKC